MRKGVLEKFRLRQKFIILLKIANLASGFTTITENLLTLWHMVSSSLTPLISTTESRLVLDCYSVVSTDPTVE